MPLPPSSRRKSASATTSTSSPCAPRSTSAPPLPEVVPPVCVGANGEQVGIPLAGRLADMWHNTSRGEEDWIPLLEQFWRPFKGLVDHTQENVKRSDVTQELIEEALGIFQEALLATKG